MSPANAKIDGEVVLAIARAAVAERLGGPALELPELPWLDEPAATFVTINKGEALHGCIGTIEARRPLGEDLRYNAVMAAFHDPRTRALRRDELDQVRISVSVLGPCQALRFADEADLRRQLRPGVDGLVLSWHGYRGVFLPQVWESLPEPRVFLDNLKRKAGLPLDFWAPDVVIERFEVDKYAERESPREARQGGHLASQR